MEFQINEAIELVKALAESENLTHAQALGAFVMEAGLEAQQASELKAAFFEEYTLSEMASDSLTNALHSVFVVGISEDAEDIQEVATKETQEGTKYKVRVKDKASGSSYSRYATRAKIAELRANPNIASVELSDYGDAGEDDDGQKTAGAKGGGKDYDGDGKVESSSKEHAGVVHNAIQRKKGGTPDGQDTRKEEVEMEEGIDFKGAKRIDDAREAKRKKEEEKHPILKDKRLMKGKFRPGSSDEEWKQGAREHLKAKDRVPSKNGKKMWEEYQALREARAKTKEEASKKLKAHQEAMKSGGKSPYFGETKKGEGKDPWSTHPSDTKAHKKEDAVAEGYKGKHGQSDKEYADSRSQGGKMVSGDSKRSGAEYTHGRRVKAENPGMQPDVGGKTKPKSQGRMDKGTRADLEYRKANLKKKEEEKKTQKEEVFLEADLVDSGRENQTQRSKKKLTGEGVDNSVNVKLMPVVDESVVIEHDSAAVKRVAKGSVNEALRAKIKEMAVQEECCPKCGTPECTCEGKEEKPRKKKAKLDEAGMPILEYSRNNATGPTPEMINPGKDPEGDAGVMNPKGKPKRYKNKGEAPGDRRPNDPSGPELPNEKGTVPNGSGV